MNRRTFFKVLGGMVGVVSLGPLILRKPEKVRIDLETGSGVWVFGDGWARELPNPFWDIGSFEMPGPIKEVKVLSR